MRHAPGAFLFAAACLPAASASPQSLPFEGGRWELSPKGASVERVDGRDALVIETGGARRPDVSLQDGTIELDVQVTRRRSFVYVSFRVEREGELEEVYLRPHKSGLPDALQYAPVYQGASAWQLHHGPGGTAAVEFEPGAWTHLKLVLQGSRAALFLGPDPKPALVASLARTPRPGSIELRAFVPPGTPGAGPVARFANVSVSASVDAGAFAGAPEPDAPPPGVVRRWAVSRAFAPPAAPSLKPPDTTALGPFQPIDAPPSGLVELHRFVTVPAKTREAACVARLRVRADRPGPRALELGFSDRATVYLNGQPLFDADQSYRFDRPRREGLIGFDQATVFLPLVAGDNEVQVVVSDSFGGWGLMGRFPDASGLEVDAR